MEKENNLQFFLIKHFIIILFAVSTLESLFLIVFNNYIMPLLKDYFHINLEDSRLMGIGLLYIAAILLLEIFVMFISMLIPDNLQWGIQWVLESLGRLNQPKSSQNTISQLQLLAAQNRGKVILLLFLVIAVVAVVATPYIVAAILYARIVIREVAKIETVREHEKQKYDRNRNLMLSDIAHDLRTPITTISGYAKALNDGMVKDVEKQKEYLSAIQNKSDRLTELTRLLFDYVRLDSEGYQLKKEGLDICELLRSSVALYYTDFEEKGIELEASIPEEIYILECDRLQMSRAFSNLMTNALRHNESGTRVKVSLEIDDERVTILFSDSGAPIPPELADHLFEPFTMGDESRSSGSGSGLGLSISRKIVEMHGGTLGLVNDYHGFSKVFIIHLFRNANSLTSQLPDI